MFFKFKNNQAGHRTHNKNFDRLDGYSVFIWPLVHAIVDTEDFKIWEDVMFLR